MKLTRRLIAAILLVCMAVALLTSASAAGIEATYSPASYYDIAVTTYSRMLAFQNGGVVAAADQTRKYGLIDTTGAVILPFQYDYVWALDGGLFAVDAGANGIGVVNAQGRTVLAPSASCVDISCKNGIIRVLTRESGSYVGNYAYYTTDWKPSTEAAYEGSSSSSGYYRDYDSLYADYDSVQEVGGYYRVWKYGNGTVQVGMLNSKYEEIIAPGDYTYVGTPNADGYVSVTKDGSTTLYDLNGNAVKTFPNKTVTTEVYFRYLAFSADGEKYGMMDMDETVLLEARYDQINSDGNNCLLTVTRDGWLSIYGLYTQGCQQVFEDRYTEITYLADGKYRLNDGTYFGVSQASGTTVTAVIPMKYVDMRMHTLQFIELYDGSKYSVVDLSNNVVVPESSEKIDVFKSSGDLAASIGNAPLAAFWDGYTESVLPFLSRTNNGWVTVYADYKTGEVAGQMEGVRASNINEEGWFVYRNEAGLYGLGQVGVPEVNSITLIYTPYASMSAADKALYYGGKLEISGLDPNTKYVVAFDNGRAASGNSRIFHVIISDMGGRIVLGCQDSMNVMVFGVSGGGNAATDLVELYAKNHASVPVTELTGGI